MIEIDVNSISSEELYKHLTTSVAPRPIALVSTVDSNGICNLSPFSFFNVFSVKPPILVFSPVNRMKDNTKKDTLKNVIELKECVISVVNQKIAQQVSLASSNYGSSEDEFKKAGFTKLESTHVKPFLIKESPVNFECKVNSIIPMGEDGGAGNLVVCEIIKIHLYDKIMDIENKIDPLKLNLVSRLGGSWYGKTTSESLYEITKPISNIGIGIDNLPNEIINSKILSGSDLAMLASVEIMPISKNSKSDSLKTEEKHILAKKLLEDEKIVQAWEILI
jgi:flavin reductase (DIM6/NTAB) family NADH-FMN oxidoreductase RutF